MAKRFVKWTSWVFVLAISLTACKKEKHVEPEDGRPIDEIIVHNTNNLVKTLGPQVQKFEFNTDALPLTLELGRGSKITIQPGTFTQNGVPVNGAVTLEAMEFLNRKDILNGGGNTNHESGAPLLSDGFVHISVKHNDVMVDKQLARDLTIAIPAHRAGLTNIWEGNIDEADGADKNFFWQQDLSRDMQEVPPAGGFYNFDFGKLGWVNCDVLYMSDQPATTLKVNILNNPGAMASFRAFTGETFVYFCPDNVNVVAQLYTPDGPNRVMSYEQTMPTNMSGTLFAFCIKDGKYYLDKKPLTITANLVETLELKESSHADLQSLFNALNTP